MQRRNFMKTVGGIGTASALGVGGMFLASTGATAKSNFDIGEVSLSSDDGTIEHISIYGDSRFEWKGLDTRATQARIKTSVIVEDLDGNELADKIINNTGRFALDNSDWGNHDDELSGPGTRGYIESGVGLDRSGRHDTDIDWAIIQAASHDDPYGLPTDPVNASNLYNSEDGTVKKFNVSMTTTYEVLDAGSNTLQTASATSSIRVNVKNIAASSSTSNGPESDGATGGAENDSSL